MFSSVPFAYILADTWKLLASDLETTSFAFVQPFVKWGNRRRKKYLRVRERGVYGRTMTTEQEKIEKGKNDRYVKGRKELTH